MGKLHEIIAIEPARKKVADKLLQESVKTLGKESLFVGQVKRLTMFDTEESHLNTEDRTDLTTTVDENLDYLVKPLSTYWDVVLQKDLTNQIAVADINIGDKVLAKDLPATFLLGMEAKLNELRKVYSAIHTLAPGITWEKDEQEKAGVFRTKHDTTAFKTEKDLEFKIAAEATKEHPAQVAQLEKTKNVGKYVITRWSGMLTPLEKANRIERIDVLLDAVKQARQRANSAEVVRGRVGETLLDFINGK